MPSAAAVPADTRLITDTGQCEPYLPARFYGWSRQDVDHDLERYLLVALLRERHLASRPRMRSYFNPVTAAWCITLKSWERRLPRSTEPFPASPARFPRLSPPPTDVAISQILFGFLNNAPSEFKRGLVPSGYYETDVPISENHFRRHMRLAPAASEPLASKKLRRGLYDLAPAGSRHLDEAAVLIRRRKEGDLWYFPADCRILSGASPGWVRIQICFERN